MLFLPRGVLPTVTTYWRRRPAGRARLAQTAETGPGDAARPDGGPLADGARLDGDGRLNGTADVLRVRGLVKAFGGLRAVDQADLAVARGSITGLIGPNGSGKTTLFNLVDGTVGAQSGEVVLASGAWNAAAARPGPMPGWRGPISSRACSRA